MLGKRYHRGFLAASLLASLGLFTYSAKTQNALVSESRNWWRDPNVSERYKNWLREDVVYIVTDQERKDFKSLTSDKQRDDFIVAFWERRNPTPGSPQNKFKEEHYRRLAYSNQHFAAGIPGWKTDRGRIYVLYGPPDSVESHPELSPPVQIWHYSLFGGCPDVGLKFTDNSSSGDYRLNDADVFWIRQVCGGEKVH